MRSIIRVLTASLIGLVVAFIFSFAGQNHASALFSNASAQACAGVNAPSSSTTCADETTSIGSLVNTVINIISWIVGIAAILMVIVGGFRYVVSGGDSTATSSARNTILYALVGLAIAVIAQVLIHFVFKHVNKALKNDKSVGVLFTLWHYPWF
jgi:hypothetical protein